MVLGIATAILMVLGQVQLGVVVAILSGGAYALAGTRPNGGSDDQS